MTEIRGMSERGAMIYTPYLLDVSVLCTTDKNEAPIKFHRARNNVSCSGDNSLAVISSIQAWHVVKFYEIYDLP